MNQKAIEETIREVLRIAIFGAVSAVVAFAATKVASLPPDSVYAIVGTVILRAVDKYIHEDPGTKAQGLVKV